MSDRTKRHAPVGRPAIAGLPPSVWVERYFRWRLDQALICEPIALEASSPVPAALPALTDPMLDTVDIGASIDRLRAETAARGIPAGLLLTERQPGSARFAASAGVHAAQRADLRIGGLLRRDGVDFLRHAYLAVLDREPDAGGLAGYLAQLNGGAVDKIAILHSLRSSPEGRRRRKALPGLTIRVLYSRLRRPMPIRYTRAVLRRLRRAAGRLPGGAGPTPSPARPYTRPSTAPVD